MLAMRVLSALLLMGAAPPQTYRIDPAASTVSARVAFFGLGSKTARFPAVRGGAMMDPANPERIDIQIRIDATAITAPDPVTLERLKGRHFFDVANHPEIVFSGRAVLTAGARDTVIAGAITARGVTRPAQLTVRFAEPPARAVGTAPLVLEGETMIDRRAFGMTAYPLIVGRMVTIRIKATLRRA